MLELRPRVIGARRFPEVSLEGQANANNTGPVIAATDAVIGFLGFGTYCSRKCTDHLRHILSSDNGSNWQL